MAKQVPPPPCSALGSGMCHHAALGEQLGAERHPQVQGIVSAVPFSACAANPQASPG